MKHGFTFDTDLCVKCKSCVMACTLENNFQTGTRDLYTYNNVASSITAIVNLSLACNHCDEPACLTGCPAQAYYRDSVTGAIVHDPLKCIGCSYCTWRCPYNAPKMNILKGHIEKCNFCVHRLTEGIDPACVTACPTGALKHIVSDNSSDYYSLLPQTELNPSLSVTGKGPGFVPSVFPAEKEEVSVDLSANENSLRKEWSLLGFSLLTTCGAGFTLSKLFGVAFPVNILIAVILVCALAVSFLHLGKISNSWRAIINIRRSPLSREIVIISAFTFISILRLFIYFPGVDMVLVTLALLSLITIDLVYISTDKSLTILTHSGQTLFSALLIASYFSTSIRLFSLLTVFAVASAVFRKGGETNSKTGLVLFYIRQFLLLLPLVLISLRLEVHIFVGQAIVITGIVADRALFYLDFKPQNIKHHIQKVFISAYEKERSKQSEDTDIS